MLGATSEFQITIGSFVSAMINADSSEMSGRGIPVLSTTMISTTALYLLWANGLSASEANIIHVVPRLSVMTCTGTNDCRSELELGMPTNCRQRLRCARSKHPTIVDS
jgi:hypothetical protein